MASTHVAAYPRESTTLCLAPPRFSFILVGRCYDGVDAVRRASGFLNFVSVLGTTVIVPTDSNLCPYLTGQGLTGTSGWWCPSLCPQTAGSLSCSGLLAFSLILVISSNRWPENMFCPVNLAATVVRLCVSASLRLFA